MPLLIPADYTKVDIPKLVSDMPKWYSIIPPLAKEWWESFLKGIDNNAHHGTQAQDSDCPIYSVKNHLQRPRTEEDEAMEMTGQLQQLREKELAPLEEVNKYNNVGQISNKSTNIPPPKMGQLINMDKLVIYNSLRIPVVY